MAAYRILMALLVAAAVAVAAEDGANVHRHPTPVITPNGVSLPWRMVDGVKVFHLVAEEVDHEFAPGLRATLWGYNGRTPGPTIEMVEGERVRIYVSNRLPEPTTVHWHGMLVPAGMDGVAGLNQPHIPVGGTFVYEFTAPHPTTYMYHPHFDEMVQMGMGLQGMLVVHPREPEADPPDFDFAIMLNEFFVPIGTARPNPMEMTDFNVLTMNSRSFPGTEPLVVEAGARIRIRFGNLSAIDNHPIHLHGHRFWITQTDGGVIPESARWPETTVLVPIGSTRSIEFTANPGDWAMHCHMTHHIMNQMGHDMENTLGAEVADLDARIRQLIPGYMTMGTDGMGAMGTMQMPMPPNAIPMEGGRGPFGHIDMGGMFTILKVRERAVEHGEAGWYEHPSGTVARPVGMAEVERDGIELPPVAEPPPPPHRRP